MCCASHAYAAPLRMTCVCRTIGHDMGMSHHMCMSSHVYRVTCCVIASHVYRVTCSSDMLMSSRSSCWGANPDPLRPTTCNARTYLQPQLNKAIRRDERLIKVPLPFSLSVCVRTCVGEWVGGCGCWFGCVCDCGCDCGCECWVLWVWVWVRVICQIKREEVLAQWAYPSVMLSCP